MCVFCLGCMPESMRAHQLNRFHLVDVDYSYDACLRTFLTHACPCMCKQDLPTGMVPCLPVHVTPQYITLRHFT